uniref:Uncharacterized protein n=1 Tax=Physcomitrium patens TaxID=3218 RepID=A9SIR9_PHYPA|nr:hypothetical protein PHYPA_019286 [Physcomitrium patens]
MRMDVLSQCVLEVPTSREQEGQPGGSSSLPLVGNLAKLRDLHRRRRGRFPDASLSFSWPSSNSEPLCVFKDGQNPNAAFTDLSFICRSPSPIPPLQSPAKSIPDLLDSVRFYGPLIDAFGVAEASCVIAVLLFRSLGFRARIEHSETAFQN